MWPFGINGILIGVVASTLFTVGTGFVSYNRGYNNATDKAERVRLLAVEKQMEETLNEIERSNKAAFEFAEWKQSHGKARVKYVSLAGSLRNCGNPPSDFIRLYNMSATGKVDVPTSFKLACSSSTIGYDTVGRITAENNANCVEYINQLNKIIDYYEGWKKNER